MHRFLCIVNPLVNIFYFLIKEHDMKKVFSGLFLFLFLIFPGDASAAPGISLYELEKELTASPEVLASAASLAGSRALEERQKAAGGLGISGNSPSEG